MTLRLVLRTLAARPVRFAVLAGGFGFGIAVMAELLGVGRVVLDQARNPALRGGGDVVVTSATGLVENARFVLGSVLAARSVAPHVATASPLARETLYLVEGASVTPIRARGGIPSLERALDDPEIGQAAAWTDTDADRAWSSPDPAEVLRSIDRFHPIPDVPARAGSWAEWLYFNGRTKDGTASFYLSFLVGPRLPSGKRTAGVRLQLRRGEQEQSFSAKDEIEEAPLLDGSSTLEIAGNRVVLDGLQYRIDLRLEQVRGRITLDAAPGKSVPPIELRGAAGWVSGYVVPVLSGEWNGTLRVEDATLDLDRAAGYHDHNWGFWEGVTWQWGQVAHDGLAFLYGRVRPPADAADLERVPGFLAVIGPEGPLGFARNVSIEERDEPGADRPRRIVVRAKGSDLDVTLDLEVKNAILTRKDDSMGFLQLRAAYRVRGTIAGRAVAFEEIGSAETFRR